MEHFINLIVKHRRNEGNGKESYKTSANQVEATNIEPSTKQVKSATGGKRYCGKRKSREKWTEKRKSVKYERQQETEIELVSIGNPEIITSTTMDVA